MSVESRSSFELASEAPAARPAEPNGEALAALLAAGGGCAMLGVFVVLAEASPRFEELMTLYAPAGSLTGKTTFAAIGWLAAWAVLHRTLRRRQLDVARSLRVTMALVAIGLLGTFPAVLRAVRHLALGQRSVTRTRRPATPPCPGA